MQNPCQARLRDFADSVDSAESSESSESVDFGDSSDFDEFDDSVESVVFGDFDDFGDFSISTQQQHHQSPRSGASTSTSYNRHVPVQYLQHPPHLQCAVGCDSTTQQAEVAAAVCN